MTKPRVALLGLGTMGKGMAGRLLQAGFPLSVYNRSRPPADALAAQGASVGATPAEAAAGAHVVISMVADDQASRAIWTGEAGALAAAERGAVLIESSTVTPGWVNELAHAAAARGCDFLDAPVTGTRPHAAEGQLVFLVGGDKATLDRVGDVLTPMSRLVVHAGPTGSGARLKLINNLLAAVQAAAFAEALAVAERIGLNRETTLEVLTNGAPGSPLVKMVAARMTANDYIPPYFSMRLMTKDIHYAMNQAQEFGIRCDTAAATLTVFERAIAEGHAEKDFAAIVEPLRGG